MLNTGRQYHYVDNMVQLYKQLQDEQSKDLFWARLQFEMEPNMDTAVRFNEIVRQYQDPETQMSKSTWRDEFVRVSLRGEKIILYGAGLVGQTCGKYILNSHADFYAFCDQNKSGEVIFGKPVLSPQEILANPSSYAVIISTNKYYMEVLTFLQENEFPMDSVLHCLDFFEQEAYFALPELLKPGTAFVDAGCYDGKDTIRFFSRYTEEAYSKIYAFEPDERNYARCKANIELAGIPNVTLFQAGLSDTTGDASFAAGASEGSYLISANQGAIHCARPEAETVTIHTVALDDVVHTEIGMIKMDIEGAEFNALHGAEQTIRRDKPLLAICIYHRQGDMLAIMDYLHSLVPEYRFWLRHYGRLADETVLYAAI